MIRKLLLAGAVGSACFAQQFEIGAKGGIPLTSTYVTNSTGSVSFDETASSATRRYTVGPMFGVWFPHGFGAEFDALYSRLGFDERVDYVPYVAATRTTAGSWAFPILARFRFSRTTVLKPHVDVGVSFRHVAGVFSSTVNSLEGFYPRLATGSTSLILDNRSDHGVTAGVGLEKRLGFLYLSPEARYTRWGTDRNSGASLHSRQNQLEVLLGVSVRKSD